ncbi:MAG TPA: peptidoglycan-binding protein LysM [Candidatus Krumholzibacteria bacterium]|nr:peptidoglycan-binding protein LysM [Candidatus Krumholzibacteria bacterium]HRX49789.1 peptidoglycan-binding protein LysM [Candidatus Krumholzibacteria bacterium]
MGFFDFLKDAGQDLSAEQARIDEEKAEKAKALALKGQIELLGLKVDGLDVGFDDGVATVSGTVPDQQEAEKVVLVLGNIQGVARVDDRLEVKAPAPAAVLYTVKSGDTLGAIAKAHYGSASKYPVIFEANTPMLKDPNKIYPGQVLRIPALD